MKRLIATVLVLTGVALGPRILSAQSQQSRNHPVEKKVEYVNHKAALDQTVARMNEELRKALKNPGRYGIIHDAKANAIKRDDVYTPKALNIGLKKDFTPEDEAARGASANFYLDSNRNPERVDVSAYYGQAGVRVNHNLKNGTGFVSVKVGKVDSLEVILNNYQDPIFKGSAHVGKYSRVSGSYDSASRSFMAGAATSYRGLNANFTWAPDRGALNASLSYSLPKDYNHLLKSVMVAQSSAPGINMKGLHAVSRVGPMDLNVGVRSINHKRYPVIMFTYRKGK